MVKAESDADVAQVNEELARVDRKMLTERMRALLAKVPAMRAELVTDLLGDMHTHTQRAAELPATQAEPDGGEAAADKQAESAATEPSVFDRCAKEMQRFREQWDSDGFSDFDFVNIVLQCGDDPAMDNDIENVIDEPIIVPRGAAESIGLELKQLARRYAPQWPAFPMMTPAPAATPASLPSADVAGLLDDDGRELIQNHRENIVRTHYPGKELVSIKVCTYGGKDCSPDELVKDVLLVTAISAVPQAIERACRGVVDLARLLDPAAKVHDDRQT